MSAAPAMDELAIEVLEQTADWIAVAKPPGLAVIPLRAGDPDDCLRARVQHQLGCALWVVHRIDRETSGVLLLATHADSHRQLNNAFEHGQVRKTYLAWCAGSPTESSGRIAIALHAARKGKMRPAHAGEPGAKAAQTDFQVERQWQLANGARIARLRCHPLSGRQHQIRVHLRAIDLPILADPLYGLSTLHPPYASINPPRLALHALELQVPAIGSTPARTVLAPVAEDLVGWEGRVGVGSMDGTRAFDGEGTRARGHEGT